MSQENLCVIYARVSSGKQKEKGMSLEVQDSMLNLHAEKHGLVVVKKWIVDEPATKPGRKGFNELVRFVRENNIKIILVQEIDRLHRNKKDEATIDELIDEGVVFHLVGEKKLIDKNGENDIFMRDIEGAVARRNVRQMVKSTSRAKMKRLEKGEYVCQTPLGYINLPPSKHSTERFKKIDEIAEKVKKLLELYSSGLYTIADMCDKAKKMDLQSKQKMEIKDSAMRYLLTNEFYCGLWEYRNEERKLLYSGTSEGQWEPIVNIEVIEKNKEILESQTGPSKKRRGYDFRFRGLLVCSHCGRTVIGEHSGRGDHKLKDGTVKSYRRPYYHCHGSPYVDKETGKVVKCPMPNFPEDLVEEHIMWNLGLLEFNEDVWNQTKRQLFDFEAKDILKQEQITLRAEQTKLEKRLDHLLDQKLEGEVKEDIYNERKPEWEKRVYEIREQLEIIDIRLDNWGSDVGIMIEIVDNLKDFKSKWEKLTPKKSDRKAVQADKKEKQRHMLKLITKRIYTYAYIGPLTKTKFIRSNKPVVSKLQSRQLNFEWSEEFEILFEMGFVKKVDELSVEKRTLPPGPGVDNTKTKKKNKLSTIQQKLDFLFSIIYLLFII